MINAFPFALDVILYSLGAMVDLYLFLWVFAGLTILNYRNCRKALHFLLIQAFMLVCIICSGYASAYLFYHNISSDTMSLTIGKPLVYLGSGINIITTISLLIKRIIENKTLTELKQIMHRNNRRIQPTKKPAQPSWFFVNEINP